jgi:hypothetical protein
VDEYVSLMNRSPQFGPRIRQGTTPQAQAVLLGSAHPVWALAGYNNGNGPGSALIQIIADYNLEQYDAPPAPAPVPTPPSTGAKNMNCTDPATGGVWFTDPTGALYNLFGAPYITGANLNTHPDWHPATCTGIFTWKDPNGEWGIGYETDAPAPGGFPFSTYRFRRDGTPD